MSHKNVTGQPHLHQMDTGKVETDVLVQAIEAVKPNPNPSLMPTLSFNGENDARDDYLIDTFVSYHSNQLDHRPARVGSRCKHGLVLLNSQCFRASQASKQPPRRHNIVECRSVSGCRDHPTTRTMPPRTTRSPRSGDLIVMACFPSRRGSSLRSLRWNCLQPVTS